VGNEVKFACVDGPEFDAHLIDFDEAMRRQSMFKTAEGKKAIQLEQAAAHAEGELCELGELQK
jgi:ferredoxin--NADP+ reductase